MNILLVTPFAVGLGGGGVGTVVRRLRESLAARGHRVLLLLPGKRHAVDALPGRADTYGLRLRDMPGHWKSALAFFLHLPLTLYSLHEFLRRHRFDVVHFHYVTPKLLYFVALRPLHRWKLVVTFHGNDVNTLPQRTATHRRLVRWALSRVDLMVGVADSLLNALTAAFPHLPTPRRVILNGNPIPDPVDATLRPELLAGLPQSYVLAVGSLIPRKGYDVLIKAIRLAADRGHKLDVVVVGGGPQASALAALAREQHVHEHIFFVGEKPYETIATFYSRARFFVHAARAEGLPLVLFEAMAWEKAVIATRVNGIPECVRDGETGLLVEPENAEGLAAAMVRLDTDEALRTALATAGQKFTSERHTWAHFTDQHLEMYASLVDRRPA